MELEDLKQAWSEYDKKLIENLKTNQQLLKEINLDRAKSEMDLPKKYEQLTMIMNIIVLPIFISWTIKYGNDIKLLISGVFTCTWTAIFTWFTLYKLKSFSNLNFYNSGLLEIQKKMIEISKRSSLAKKFELYSSPLFVIIASPIVAKAIRGFNIFNMPYYYKILYIIILLFVYPGVIWIYKHVYEKKIEKTNEIIKELNKFEQEI